VMLEKLLLLLLTVTLLLLVAAMLVKRVTIPPAPVLAKAVTIAFELTF